MNDVSAFVVAYPWFSGAVFLTILSLLITSAQSLVARARINHVDIGKEMSEAQQSRLWDHAIHEDKQYNDRLNFFLIFESVLLGVVGAIYAKETVSQSILIAIAGLGVIITLVWINIQAYHHFYLDSFNPRLLHAFAEFKKTVEYSRLWWPDWGRQLLSYGVPIAVAAIWLVILALVENVHLF
jgi:hypothetical protein